MADDGWVRFSAYSITDDGFIEPAAGARFERYDPIDEVAAQDSDCVDGLTRLAAKLRVIPMDDTKGISKRAAVRLIRTRFEGFDRDAVRSWCGQWGLLGLLHQSLVGAQLCSPTGDPSLRRLITWSFGRWLDLEENVPDAEGFPETILLSGTMPGAPDAATPSAMIAYIKDIKDSRSLPRMNSDAFWRSYREPVGEFLMVANQLRLALAPMPTKTQLRRAAKYATPVAIDVLNAWASRVSPAIRLQASGELQLSWASPSLIGVVGHQAMTEVAAGTRLIVCKRCGNQVLSRRSKKAYCSETCRNTAETARYRAKKKKSAPVDKRPSRARAGAPQASLKPKRAR